jgi:hypothetical protein
MKNKLLGVSLLLIQSVFILAGTGSSPLFAVPDAVQASDSEGQAELYVSYWAYS